MLTLGPLAFAAPWLLLAAALLPVLWWLLRVTPPSPRQLAFPPIRLLLALKPQEETPARTPLWLILMRMLLALLIILAVSHPLLNPTSKLHGSGPLILVIDDGWAASSDWTARREAMDAAIDQAEREDRPVSLLTTARAPADQPLQPSQLMRAADARRVARTIEPKPWPTDRSAALAAMKDVEVDGSAQVMWLSDGLDGKDAAALAARLQELGGLRVLSEPAGVIARVVQPPDGVDATLTVPVLRATDRGEQKLWIRAASEDGRMLARERVSFAEGKRRATATLELPGELRNQVARVAIEDEDTAGAVFLLDERWRRRPVGLVSGEALETAQPLLGSIYYLERALKPFSEVRHGTVSELLERELAVLVLADIGKFSESEGERLAAWIKRGGVVVRFAGPKLAKSADALIPVRLRGGGRILGGAMSWSQPASLAPFGETGPFAGLDAARDIRIQRQVLAEPSPALNAKTWARLSDGTPLVTAEQRERGWLILVHTTANTDWSNLPISGLFVAMLKRVVALSQGVVSDNSNVLLPPLQSLDGFGRLGNPPPSASAIRDRDFAEAIAGPASPPGYYGNDAARRTLNLASAVTALAPMDTLPAGVERAGYDRASVFDFKPWLLLAALLLCLADLVVAYFLRGMASIGPTRQAGAAVFALIMIASMAPALAQTNTAPRIIPEGPDRKALLATLETRLAYVVSGDARIDEVSRAGLNGLGRVLRRRTAVEPGDPMAVDIETDELAFFPLLFWAVSPRQRLLSDRATEKLNQYLRSGGTILFDTRERGRFMNEGGGGPASQRLRLLLRGLDIPTLIPVPRDHVLTKAFYLLSDFPGRWTGAAVWVERRGGRHNDGVSSVIIGANDWAAAWAVDDFGAAQFPVVPGGELQREMAYRFGVNWVMYALTGNYKTDQVHVPAIIERLGQ
jgi:hypothetical protein